MKKIKFVAFLLMCMMVMSNISAVAANDITITYSFEEGFDTAKTEVVSSENVETAYSQFVSFKVQGEGDTLTDLTVSEGKVSTASTMTYSLSSVNAVPMPAEYVVDPTGKKASYVVDFDLKRTNANIKKAVYLGFRIPSAHATLSDVFYDTDSDKGLWFGFGTNFAVAPILPEDGATNLGTGKRWASLRKDGGNANSITNHTHFRAYDNVKDNVITIYMVEEDNTEVFYASMTIGTYNATEDVTPVTFQVMATDAETLNIPGEIYSGETCYPQLFANTLKPEIGHFGVTGCGVDNAGLTSLELNGLTLDLDVFEYNSVTPLDGSVITVEAYAGWGTDYTISTYDEATEEWTVVPATNGVNTIDVSSVSKVKVAVNACGEEKNYVFSISDATPGIVSASPEEGHFETAQEITLTGSGKEGAEIYYTTDGTDPKENGTLYEAPFTVPADAETTVKAVEKIGEVYGTVAEFVYDIYVDVEEPAFSLPEGSYVTERQFTLSTVEDTTIYYTMDESDPTDENNTARQEYTGAITLENIPDVKTTYVVKAVAFRNETYSEVITKTYAIGVQKEIYTVDPAALVEGEDPNFKNYGSFTLADASAGWLKLPATNLWDMAVLKTPVSSQQQGYQMEFDVRNFDDRIHNGGLNIMLRKRNDETSGSALSGTHRDAPIIMIYKNCLGLRNNTWGENCTEMVDIPGLDLSEGAHITVTDDFVTGISVVYINGKAVAYGKLTGTNYTLTSISTGDSASVTLTSELPNNGYVAMAVTHTPAQIKDLKVITGRPEPFNNVFASHETGEYEVSITVSLKNFNEELTHIYYTLDGSDPSDEANEGRILYTTPFVINSDITLKAVAVGEQLSSEVYEWDYTIIPYQPEKVVFSHEGGEYPSTPTVTLAGSNKPGAVIYYTLDGSDPSSSTNTGRVTYSEGVAIPNNAETTLKAVEVIGELTGEVTSATYYTGTVQAPATTYYADMLKLAYGEEPNWVSQDSRIVTQAFRPIEGKPGSVILCTNPTDGNHTFTTAYFKTQFTPANRAYKLDLDVEAMNRPGTHTALYITPRAPANTEITAYTAYPRFSFVQSKIGIRTGAWGENASSFLDIPGMNIANSSKITLVDDMEKNIISIFIDDELKAMATIESSKVTLTAVETGESVVWNGTAADSGYINIASAHNSAEISNVSVTYPYSYDLNVAALSSTDSIIGPRTITLKNYFGTRVYYTLDGSDPADAENENRILYTTPFEIGIGQTTLKAVYYNSEQDTYGGYLEKTYRLYESEENIIAELDALATDDSLTMTERETIISAVFDLAGFTIKKDSYYKKLSDEEVWVTAFIQVLKETKARTAEQLTVEDAKLAAYRAAVVAYFMDTITAADVAKVVEKANDSIQQYKMNIPLVMLGFENMGTEAQNHILRQIKDNPMPDTENLNRIMFEVVALSAVSPEFIGSRDYLESERATALLAVMTNSDILTEDDTFARWGAGSKKQNKVISAVLEVAKEQNINTIDALKTVVSDAIDDVENSGGGSGNDGPSTSSGYGGTTGGNTALGTVEVPEIHVKFADAKKDAPWAYNAIVALSNNGIVSGYEDETFRANNSVTREEFVKMLVVALGIYDKNATCTLTDAANGNWYDTYIASAVNHEIVMGVSETEFGVGVNISRQDMAVITFRALKNLNVPIPDAQIAMGFSDEGDISDYAKAAVTELQEANIINGMGDGTFAPFATANRAQAAYIIYSIFNIVNA